MRDRTDLFPVEISETLPEQRLNIESIDGMDIEFVDPEGGVRLWDLTVYQRQAAKSNNNQSSSGPGQVRVAWSELRQSHKFIDRNETETVWQTENQGETCGSNQQGTIISLKSLFHPTQQSEA